MKGRYDRAIAQAEKQICKDGQSVLWQQPVTPTPSDDNKPWKGMATSAPTQYPVKMVFLPNGKGGTNALISYLTGKDVVSGKGYALMAAQTFTPSVTDTVIRDGKALAITSIDPLAPNGQVILYTVTFKL